MNSNTNPYQTPIATNQVPDRYTGSWFLIGGMVSFAACVIVVGFVMIAVIPEMKDAFEDVNRPIPGFVELLVKVADHFVKFWFIYLVFGVCTLILIERSGDKRKQCRIVAGVALVLISVSLTFLAGCATFIAMS